MNQNNLIAEIPDLSALELLETLDFSHNSLSGSIPNTFAPLKNLKVLYMNGNNLIGEIPDLSTLELLETLDFSHNSLSGSIPNTFAPLKNLKVLYMNENNLIGEIPDLSTLELLETLDFSHNSLSGPIPNTFASLKNLKVLYMNGNNINGEIPDLNALELLETLDFSHNNLSGSIPSSLSAVKNLKVLYMNENNLKGEIPDLSALELLETLDLSDNHLSGPIPSSLATFKNLKALYLQNNNLSGTIPTALLQRRQTSSFTFEFSGNPSLCDSISSDCSHPPTPVQRPRGSKSKLSTGITVGISVAGILLLGVAIGFVTYFIYKKKKSSVHNGAIHEGLSQVELAGSECSGTVIMGEPIPAELHVRRFSYKEVEVATNNFTTILGQGGFGPVYKGWLDDGRVVAIKVSSNISLQGSKEFLNEIDLLSRVHHKCLVRLLGYCNEEKQVLVYEFMSEGSLFEHLHGPHSNDNSVLPWVTRLRIILDAAHGLSYLHEGCSPQIIHRDIKSSNILLNDQMEAKISDFGISRNQPINGTGAPPTAVMGTLGYVDPAYIKSLNMTERIDVYSFGVLLFEIVSGRRPIFESLSSKQSISIIDWAKSSFLRDNIDDIIDPSLHGQYNVESVRKVVHVAVSCVEMPSFKRPRMSQVYQDLKEALEVETSELQGSY
ncbi:hypothetical protein KP509_18G020700 [Ceratopteris richardii]|nr:hypothetical protein KP509_18G020700 [Ceratopteris richardii]